MALIYDASQTPVQELTPQTPETTISTLLGISPSGTAVELAVKAIINYVPRDVIAEAVDAIIEDELDAALAGRFVDDITGPQGTDEHRSSWTINATKDYINEVGTEGPRGYQGYQGYNGIDGYQGHDGATGPQGQPGTGITVMPFDEWSAKVPEEGDAYIGDDGWINIRHMAGGAWDILRYQYRGDRGYQGYQGETGAQGYQGEVGETGPQGHTGAQGYQGFTGAQGVQGPTGVQGPRGDNAEIRICPTRSSCVNIGDSYIGDGTIDGPCPGDLGYLYILTSGSGDTGSYSRSSQPISGPRGWQGYQGNTGSVGPAPNMNATATTKNPGEQASASISGSGGNYTLTIGVPRGNTGPTGATGATGPTGSTPVFSSDANASPRNPGQDPRVSLSGQGTNSSPYKFSFEIPKGDTGPQGATSTVPGPMPVFDSNGSASSLEPGSTPTVEVSGAGTQDNKYKIKIGVPKGAKGDQPVFNPTGSASSLEPGSNPTVSISGSGTSTDKYKLTLGIPKGAKGDQPVFDSNGSGSSLNPGSTPTVSISGSGTSTDKYKLSIGVPKGDTGPVAKFNPTGSASSLNPGSNPTVSISGSGSQNDPYVLNLGVPKGATGDSYWTPDSQGNTLTFSGTGGVHAKAFYEDSDVRLKNIIENLSLDRAIDIVNQVPAILYTLKTDDKVQIGVSAQQLQKVAPELVSANEDGYLSVAYDRLAVICMTVLKYLLKYLLNK